MHVTDEPSGRWLENSIRYSVDGVNGSNAGSGLVLAKLSEVLFVETLRRYINALPSEQVGCSQAPGTPSLGRRSLCCTSIPLIPGPSRLWQGRVGLSRSRLTERFRHFLGQSPMAYLAQWRLELGAESLRSTDDSVVEIALAVGYGSEAAFNRAFKREFDCPPAQFRRSHKA